MPGFYDDPALYDVLHAPGTADDVRELLAIAGRYAPRAVERSAVWLEPACGTGRLLGALANRGFKAIGFDSSHAMVRFANGRLPRGASVFNADMTDFARHIEPHSIDFAFNPINTIRHLTTDRAVLTHLGAIARVLAPDAVYCVGMGLALYGVEEETEDVWSGKQGATQVKQVVQYLPAKPPSRTEKCISHITVTRGRRTTDFNTVHTLRTYSAEQWDSLLRKSVMEIVAVCDEAAEDVVPTAPGYYNFILAPRDRAAVRRSS